MCIDATVSAAFDFSYGCTVLHDACAARPLSYGGETVPAASVHTAFLAALNGIYARVISTGEFIAS